MVSLPKMSTTLTAILRGMREGAPRIRMDWVQGDNLLVLVTCQGTDGGDARNGVRADCAGKHGTDGLGVGCGKGAGVAQREGVRGGRWELGAGAGRLAVDWG